ncbi:MAG: ABC transporter substrate-binding protein [Burkholderiales bacterium]|nr:ABC transporter substrate-binding protein [Burkholderiales bacterium]
MKIFAATCSSFTPKFFLLRCFLAAVTLLAIHTNVVAEATTVRIGIPNVSSDVGFFIADKKGYFRQEGLNVTFTSFNSAAKMMAPLGAGQLDVGGGTVSAGLYNAVARGIHLKIVADKGSIKPGYGFSSLLVRKDHVDGGRYKSWGDLKGMKVAIGASGTGTASALNEALKKGGLKYKDVDVVDMAFPQHVLAFANKAIDASITNEPTVTRAVKDGVAVRVAGNDVFYPDQQTAVVLYGGEFIKNQPEAARKFMRAYIRAIRDYNDALKDGKIAGPNADEIIAILTEYTAIKDASIYRVMTPNACDPDGHVNVKSLHKDFDFFKEQGLIEGKVTVEQAIDNSFAEAVLKELGPYRPKKAK